MFSGVENDYNGPALVDGQVTLQFLLDLMEWYKSQKTLHRKFAYKVCKDFTTCIHCNLCGDDR